MAKEDKKPTYEETAEQARKNLNDFEAFYYASLAKQPEHGKEGARDSAYIALSQLDGDKIKSDLESMVESSIESGDGVEATFSLRDKIGKGAQNFIQALLMLKPKEINEYIKDRLGVEIPMTYDKVFAELIHSEDETEKEYASYMLGQVRNAAMAKFASEAYKIRAGKDKAKYDAEHPAKKES